MKRETLVEDIKYIKEVISSSMYYTNLSGIAAIISGMAALLGCLISYLVLRKPAPANSQISNSILYELSLTWVWVFCISVIAHIYFIVRKAKKTGEPAWSRLARLIIYALSPPLLIGAALTVFLAVHQQMLWIPAAWMISYGLGVWSAALFSIKEPRWLGASFIITGMITLFFLPQQSLTMLAVSFGGYHIIYGLRLIVRYGG